MSDLHTVFAEKLTKRGIAFDADELKQDIENGLKHTIKPEQYVSTQAMVQTKNLELEKKTDPVAYMQKKTNMMIAEVQRCLASGEITFENGQFKKTDSYCPSGIRQLDNRIAKITGTKVAKTESI